MDVLARRHGIDQCHTGLVIEFDENYRAMDAIVEHAIVVVVSDPRKVCRIKMSFNLA